MDQKAKLPRYEVGYQLSDENFSFTGMIRQFLPHIDTVYFPWLDSPSGRASLTNRKGYITWGALEILKKDLLWCKANGMRLNLLFNGNCYGELSASKYLQNNIYSVIEYLSGIEAAVDIVTTCSPAIAEMIKRQFPSIKVRASVNMRIGTVKGMEYLSDVFDEFNIQREYNRDLGRIRILKEWADENGKGLVLLANSGCFNFCSAQTFHDNLVAHEKGISEMDNIIDWAVPNCRKLLRKRENWKYILQGSWIRPEDISRYAEFFPVIKLATRMHENPWIILYSYIKQSYSGSITDLMEPSFSNELSPFVLDNHLFPDDWFEKTSTCDKECHICGYCEKVLNKVLVDSKEFYV